MVGADETKELRQIPVKLLLGRSQEILGEEDFLEILAIRVLQNSRANQQHNGKRLLIQSFLVGTTILSFALASLIPSCKTEDQEINSVTKCWSKKSTNFLQQLAKKYPQQSYVKRAILQQPKHLIKHFGYFCNKFVPRNFQNRPIWSHWTEPILTFQNKAPHKNLKARKTKRKVFEIKNFENRFLF